MAPIYLGVSFFSLAKAQKSIQSILYFTAKRFSVPTNISGMKQYCCETHTKSQQLFFKPFSSRFTFRLPVTSYCFFRGAHSQRFSGGGNVGGNV